MFETREERGQWLGVRLTETEHRLLQQEARRRGETLSELARAALGAFLTADSTPTQGEVLPCQTRN